MRSFYLSFVSLAILTAHPALASPRSGLPAYVGKWAYKLAWCGNQDGEKVPVTVTVNQLQGLENTCYFTRITADRTGWDIKARCDGEGQTYRDAFHLSVENDRLIQEGSSAPLVLRRCPR